MSTEHREECPYCGEDETTASVKPTWWERVRHKMTNVWLCCHCATRWSPPPPVTLDEARAAATTLQRFFDQQRAKEQSPLTFRFSVVLLGIRLADTVQAGMVAAYQGRIRSIVATETETVIWLEVSIGWLKSEESGPDVERLPQFVEADALRRHTQWLHDVETLQEP